MNPFERTFMWSGGAIFAGALAFCGYTFVVTWSTEAGFDAAAIPADVLLFSVFAFHHSVFAREPVKRWLAQLLPERLLRSVYVWIASLLLMSLCVLWRRIGADVYHVTGWRAGVHAALQIAGILLIVGAVRAIDALELAGIRSHSTRDQLQIIGPYRWVRHPLYLGWILATFGAAHMTMDRFVFAAISAFYLIIAMPIEERSLREHFGDAYIRYERQVRWRVAPYIY